MINLTWERILELEQLAQWAEIIGAVAGAVSVYLLSIGNGRGWAVGAVTIVLTGFVCFHRELYGTASLQLFFLLMQLIGWIRWVRGEEKDLRKGSKSLTSSQTLGLACGLLLLWFGFHRGLLAVGGKQALADSFATAGSVWAQILMVLQFRQCWLLWLTVDVVYVGILLNEGLWAFTLLYVFYCGLAWNGWRQWTRDPGT